MKLTEEEFWEGIENGKVIDREKHYRHNAEHRTVVFPKDGKFYQVHYTCWEDNGPEIDNFEAVEVEEKEIIKKVWVPVV